MKHAILMAGGKGTRLKPYTTVIPKPLVPIGEHAVLEILLKRLRASGVTDVTICVNHFAQLIMAYFGDGSRYNLKLNYSLEDKPLGTVGPLKLIPNLPDHFLVMNGDLLTDIDFDTLFNHHIASDRLLTIGTYERTVKIDYGVIETDQTGRISNFKEKPEYGFQVSMGVYVMSKKILDHIPEELEFGFDKLIGSLLSKEIPVNTYKYSGYWLDIGRPEDYEKANQDLHKILI